MLPKERREKLERADEDTVVEEFESSFMPDDDYEAALLEIRNASIDDDVNDTLERLRGERRWYSKYELAMEAENAELRNRISELEKENAKLFIRKGKEVIEQQNEDILEDVKKKTFASLWEESEG